MRSRDGIDAIDLITRLRPTVIVLDILLPDTDGWEILRDHPRSSRSAGET